MKYLHKFSKIKPEISYKKIAMVEMSLSALAMRNVNMFAIDDPI